MAKVKVLLVFGTRPEAIKMGPVVKVLENNNQFEPVVVSTGQHAKMLQQVLEVFNIQPDYDLQIMKTGQTLTGITQAVMTKLEPILQREQPNIVLVHGDTSSAYAAALTAFYNRIAIGHVEAGLRTWNKYSPYPEEMNRQMIDDLADLMFAPTQTSVDNLAMSHHTKGVFETGNTAIDALRYTVNNSYSHPVLKDIAPDHKVILLTMHRRENWGSPMEETFKAIREVVDNRDDLDVIYPVHLNPKVQEVANKILGNDPHFHLIEPLDVIDFHNLMNRAYLVMTDSGGVQEEAPSLHKPVLVLRDTTERPEGVKAGTLKLIGTDYHQVKAELLDLLNDSAEYHKMSRAKNPYGDGHASERIADSILKSKF